MEAREGPVTGRDQRQEQPPSLGPGRPCPGAERKRAAGRAQAQRKGVTSPQRRLRSQREEDFPGGAGKGDMGDGRNPVPTDLSHSKHRHRLYT